MSSPDADPESPWPVRLAGPDEIEALASLFERSVRALAPRAYRPEQVEVWAALARDLPAMRAWLSEARTWVFEAQGALGGFCTVDASGLVRALYLRPDCSGRGLALRLLLHALGQARRDGCSRFTTHASHLSRPVFARAGFQVVEVEQVERGGLSFERFRMRT